MILEHISIFLLSPGSQFGTVLAMPLSGLLANSSLGWPSIFYVIGGLGILWSVLWFFLGANAPAVCKKISEEEKAYIQSSLGQTLGDNDKVINFNIEQLFFTSFVVLYYIFLGKDAHSMG